MSEMGVGAWILVVGGAAVTVVIAAALIFWTVAELRDRPRSPAAGLRSPVEGRAP